MIDLSGHELGRYRVVAPLGRGGMAAVFKAFDPKVQREVAVKVLPPEMAEGDADYVARFEREAQVIASLDHPNIVPVFDFGEARGFTFMVMPLIAGGSLDAKIEEARRAGRFLPLDEVGRVVAEVASALSYAHGRELVHRDLKPSNVLIDEQGRSRLADFGIARLLASSTRLTQSGAVMGTPRYMSPEQALGKPTDASTDVYALGVMLYELLTLAAPFDAETPLAVLMKHVNDPLPLPRSLRPELPEAVEGVVLKAMAKDPAQRWGGALELADAFARALEGSSATAPPAELAGPTLVTGAPGGPPAPPTSLPAASAPPSFAAGGAVATGAAGPPVTAPPSPPAPPGGTGGGLASPPETATYAPVRLSPRVVGLGLVAAVLLLLLAVGTVGLLAWLRLSDRDENVNVAGAGSAARPQSVADPATAQPESESVDVEPRTTSDPVAGDAERDSTRDDIPAVTGETAPTAVVVGEAPSDRVAAPARPAAARLQISASRSDVEIGVDGTRRGTAPLTVEVEPGRRTVTATLAGCESSRREVDVSAGSGRAVRFELECPELEWQARQVEMESEARRIEALDAGRATAEEKAEAWGAFLAAWSADNPYTEDDDGLRTRARERADHWAAEASKPRVSWRRIPAGSFTMGCTPGDGACYDDEEPAHTVRITRAFDLAETETTNAQYRACVEAGECELPTSRGLFDDPELVDHPVVGITWLDAVDFCSFAGGRLPTEAEWEYAARGGRSGSRYPWGDELSRDDANYEDEDDDTRDVWERTAPVRSFAANGYGLYDMAGNVFEWVADWYDDESYQSSPSADPVGVTEGEDRVLRGGSWDVGWKALRVSRRENAEPDDRDREWGVRCARDS